jgi:hypothetical protein
VPLNRTQGESPCMARMPRRGPGGGAAPTALLLRPDGPCRAWRPGRSGLGRATGSTQSGRIGFLFFSNLFLMRKQIPEKSRNCLKARKILRKSQEFYENS